MHGFIKNKLTSHLITLDEQSYGDGSENIYDAFVRFFVCLFPAPVPSILLSFYSFPPSLSLTVHRSSGSAGFALVSGLVFSFIPYPFTPLVSCI